MAEDLLKQLVDEIKKLSQVLQNQNQRIEKLEQVYREHPKVVKQDLDKEPAQSLESMPIEPEIKKPLESIKESLAKMKNPKEDIESKVGSKYLNWIGIGVLVIAFVFFLSYAFENNWIGPWGQIAIGVISGLLLIGIGEYYHSRYQLWSKAFTGAGLALLYITIYAAWSYFEKIEPNTAFISTIIVTVLGGIFAIRYNSKIVGVFVILGGFLSPLLISGSDPSYIGMLTYILILDLGILLLNYFKNWKDLNVIAFIATVAYSFMLYEVSLGMALLFLFAFYFLFSLVSVVYNFVNSEKIQKADAVLIILNNIFLFGHLAGLLLDDYEKWLGMIALVLAALSLVKGYFAYARELKDRYLIMIYLSLTTAYVAVSLGILLEQKWIIFGWLIESLLLFWIGFRLKQRTTRVFGFILLLLALTKLFILDSSVKYSEFTIFANDRFVVYLLMIVSLYLLSYWYYRYRDGLPDDEKKLGTYLAIFANILTVGYLTLEINDFYKSLRLTESLPSGASRYTNSNYSDYRQKSQLVISVVWAVYAIISLIVGIVKRFKPIRLLALILFGITIFKIAFVDLAKSETIYRIITFFVLGVLMVFASYLYTRFKDNVKDFILEEKDDDEAPTEKEKTKVPINEDIEKMDISGIEKVTFHPVNDTAFSTAEVSIIKIARYVENLYDKNNFEPGELDHIYKFFMENYQRTIPEEKYEIAVKKLASFVANGGNFKFN